jgi:type I restriction enzyme M protein
MYLNAEPVDGELAVVTSQQAADADYNLSPSRWTATSRTSEALSVRMLLQELQELDRIAAAQTARLAMLLSGVNDATRQ